MTLNLLESHSSSTPRKPDYYYRAAKRECSIEVAQSNLPPDVLHVQGGNGPIEQCLRGRGFGRGRLNPVSIQLRSR